MKIKIRKLEDLPSFIPIIYIQDKGFKNSTPRMLGNNSHDVLVVSDNKRCLHYYNCQCGDGSDYGDFRFVKRNKTCIDDYFYSCWVDMVDLDALIHDHDITTNTNIINSMISILKEKLSIPTKDDDFNNGYRFAQKEILELLKSAKEKINDGKRIETKH